MPRVLALDPGDSVGWARADIDTAGNWTDLRHGITPLKQCALDVADALSTEPPDIQGDGLPAKYPDYDTVVCERWALYGHMAKHLVGSEIPSAQFIGAVKLSCWRSGTPLVMQSAHLVNSNKAGVLAPAEAAMKKLRPELFELVTRPGAHDDQHDLVAIKHLFYYTFKHFPVENQ